MRCYSLSLRQTETHVPQGPDKGQLFQKMDLRQDLTHHLKKEVNNGSANVTNHRPTTVTSW